MDRRRSGRSATRGVCRRGDWQFALLTASRFNSVPLIASSQDRLLRLVWVHSHQRFISTLELLCVYFSDPGEEKRLAVLAAVSLSVKLIGIGDVDSGTIPHPVIIKRRGNDIGRYQRPITASPKTHESCNTLDQISDKNIDDQSAQYNSFALLPSSFPFQEITHRLDVHIRLIDERQVSGLRDDDQL